MPKKRSTDHHLWLKNDFLKNNTDATDRIDLLAFVFLPNSTSQRASPRPQRNSALLQLRGNVHSTLPACAGIPAKSGLRLAWDT